MERHGTGQIAYLPAQQVAVESEAGKAEQGLRKLGASVVVTEGNFETNRNDLTTRHIDAVTAPGGTIYISNQTQIPAELIVAHEGLHFLQRQNSPLYDNFYDTILANIDFNSNVYDEVAGQINDEHFGGSLDIRSPDAVQSIFTELTAYIHQWLTVDPEHAKNTFGGMFRDWDAVVEASRALREAMDRGIHTEGSGEYGGEKNFLGGYFRRGKGGIAQESGVYEGISEANRRSERKTIETERGRAEFEAVQERNLSKKQKKDNRIAQKYGYPLYHVPEGSTVEYNGKSEIMSHTAMVKPGLDAVFALDGTEHDYVHHELFHKFMEHKQHGEGQLLEKAQRAIDYDSDRWNWYFDACKRDYRGQFSLDIVYEEITGDLCEYAMSGSETMRNRLEGLFEPGTLDALCKEARRVFAANRTGKQVGEGSSQNQSSSDRKPRYYLEKTGERNVNNIHNASQEKAKPLSAEAVVNTEKGKSQQTTVQGIAKVSDGSVEVKLKDGGTVPLADVEFTNPTLGSLYEAAGNYVTGTAKAFVAGYDGSLPLTQYQAAFEFIHNQAVKGVAMDAAVEAAGDVGQRLSNSARKLVYNSGLRDAQVLHSTADNGRIEATKSETRIYRRVQGGEGNQSSQQRLLIDNEGNVYIRKKDKNLNVSIDNGEHAQYFIQNKRAGANIYEFEVPKWFDDMVQEYSIPQAGYKNNPLNQGGTAPKLTDPTTPGKSIEFPEPWIEWMEEYARNGKIINEP